MIWEEKIEHPDKMHQAGENQWNENQMDYGMGDEFHFQAMQQMVKRSPSQGSHYWEVGEELTSVSQVVVQVAKEVKQTRVEEVGLVEAEVDAWWELE